MGEPVEQLQGDAVSARKRRTTSHSNRNGFSLDQLRAAVAEAMAAEQRLRHCLALAQATMNGDVPVIPAGQPYPYRTKPLKMCPPEFQLTKRQMQAGLDEGLADYQVRREFEKFKDYTFVSAKSDWDATWRNWIRTSAEKLPRMRPVKPATPLRQAATRTVAREEEEEEAPASPAEALVSIRGLIDKFKR